MKTILNKIKRNKSLSELNYYLCVSESNNLEYMTKEDIIKETEWILSYYIEGNEDMFDSDQDYQKQLKATRKILEEMKAL